MPDPEIHFITDYDELRPELEYVCKLFSSILTARFEYQHGPELSDPNKPCLSYMGEQPPPHLCRINVTPDRDFWNAYQSKNIPELKWENLNNTPVLITCSTNAAFKQAEHHIQTTFDIFSASFFQVTRMEEIFEKHPQDEHGRYLFKNSIVDEETILRPLINEYAGKLCDWLNQTYDLGISFREDRFSTVISHDVDIPYYYGTLRSQLSEVFQYIQGNSKYKSASDVFKFVTHLLGCSSDPFDTYEYIRQQEAKRSICSTWFILMSPDNQWGMNKKKYSMRLQWLVSQNCEIGIHPGYDSAFDVSKIIQEKQEVEELARTNISGVRNHFLRFSFPDSLSNYEEIGLRYDSTLSYAEQEGYRAGIATPFKPFDIISRREINILEIPLIIMDGVLKDYRGMDPEQASKQIEKLVDIVSNTNSVMVFNWHNTFLARGNETWRRVFEQSLDYLIEKNAKFIKCGELASYWSNCWN